MSVHAWVKGGFVSFVFRAAAAKLALKLKLSLPVSRLWQRRVGPDGAVASVMKRFDFGQWRHAWAPFEVAPASYGGTLGRATVL